MFWVLLKRGGNYRCFVAAATPPEIVKPLKNANAIQNHNAQFVCTITGNPKPTITW